MSNKVAIITANYGGVDILHPAIEQSIACDFFAFGHTAVGWTTPCRNLCGRNLSNIYRAKIPKILPEYATCSTDYEWFIWMDGSCHITDSRFAEWMIDNTHSRDWGLFRHSKRDTVGDEVSHSLGWDRYADHPLEEQFVYYRRLGFQDNQGLFECGVFARRSTSLTRAICADWMNQIMLWSYQDQISLPFVMWQYHFKPSLLPKTVLIAPYHSYHGHDYGYTISERLHTDISQS